MPKYPKEKLFCPSSMKRYDCYSKDYPIKWICRNCLKCLLSKEAVNNHLNNCSGFRQFNPAPPIPTKKNEDTPYKCKYCNKVFPRGVVLKKHLEDHEKPSSRLDLSGSSLSDSELSDTEDEYDS